MDNKQLVAEEIVTPELYFLITKYLADSPLRETAKVLIRELETKKVLPKRIDWLGGEHDQTFKELEQKYAHITSNYLLEICCRIGPILDKELAPSVPGIISLLGAGRQSLLRTKETIYRSRTQLDYCTRLHGVSLPDSSVTKPIHNFQKVIIGREYGGCMQRKLLVSTAFYGKTKLLRRTVGHLSSVYCVLFDRTGRYIITGADDLLIKIWSAIDGRLLATLRGASAEITDIAINIDNTMLAAGSLDRILRVWDMQTTSPIAVLSGHTGMITSVNFCPSPRSDMKYLVTTSTDGSIAFWQYSTPRGQKATFAAKPIQFMEKLRPGQAQMMCTTFSPGGMFLAAGSADHHVRVYQMGEEGGPKRILEVEAYTDAVDSAQWSHRGLRFISGSKDGTAHIWTYESMQWRSTKLCMTERLSSCPEHEDGKKLKVTMVAWDCSDKYVITAVNDFTIKIWNSKTGKLHRVLRGHKDELYVLESNPKDAYVLLSAGHDGQVFLWDIEEGIAITSFINDIDGQGHGSVFDAKWSPDGTMIAATDSHGHILIFGLGIGPEKYQLLPTELFFHTDYRPLLRDASHHVVDEQTQIMPHLMAPPFLVDADGNPHPSKYQRFVLGRENCTTDQLIPNYTVGADGVIIDDSGLGGAAAAQVGISGNYSHIDRLIAALANRQGNPSAHNSAQHAASNQSQLDRMIEALANRSGQDQSAASNNRRENIANNTLETTAARANSWARPAAVVAPAPAPAPAQQQQQQPQATAYKYIKRVFVRPMKYSQLQALRQRVFAAGQFEMQEFKRESRKRPIMINTSNVNAVTQATQNGRNRNTRSSANARGTRTRNSHGSQQPRAYRTRAQREQEVHSPTVPEEEEDEESSNSSGDTSYSNVEEHLRDSSDDTDDSESSDYSDWVADTPGPNLEPPKRSKRKPLSRCRQSSPEISSDETTEQQQQTNKNRRQKRVIIPHPTANGEIPELYRPSEWLSEVIPRKTPYYPQMGDEVVYFRQGHQRYLEAVRTKKLYKLTHSSEPWNFQELRDHEFLRVIGIKYEIRPPRLCCLKLALLDAEGNMTGGSIKVKYHDMPDVLDFLVLRQTFDLAVQRNWSLGDRFRCMIGDGWWMGQIESRHILNSEFPDSYFMCFRVRWDNGEYEYMSPWDMEPIDEQRMPEEVGGRVAVLPEEIRATLYQPKSEEWHRGDRDGSCRRIINGMEQVMRLSIAEHFLAPVDLNIYPDYAYLIEYPIDLTTIKSRFENHFYRRITSAQFDVRYLATNAEKYNRSHTNIVKHARIITDLCLRVIREPNDIDVAAVYHQLVDVYHSSETENENESDVVPSTSTGPTISTAAARKSLAKIRRSNRIRSDNDWRSDCRQLLDIMWQRADSEPFREPVDTIEFPDYLEIINTPMDLRTVKEDLLGGNYDDPLEFAKDVRVIFENSKNYNTNKRSRIYAMTLRLSAFFETHIKTVLSNWKATKRRVAKSQKNARTSSSVSPSKRRNQRNRTTTARRKNAKNRLRLHSSEDDDVESEGSPPLAADDDEEDDDDDDDDDLHNPRPSGSKAISRNGHMRRGVRVNATSQNRVISANSTQTNTHATNECEPIRARRSNRHKSETESDEEEEDEEELEDEEDSDETSASDTKSSASEDEKKASKRAQRKIRRNNVLEDEEDSEESYKPTRRSKNKLQRLNNKNSAHKHRRQLNDKYEDSAEENVPRAHPAKRKTPAKAQLTNGRGGSLSQVDESTQEAETPLKGAKGSKTTNTATFDDDGPSTSASALLRMRQEQQRTAPSRSCKRNRPLDNNDHSYHLPVRCGRLIDSDTDSREAVVRSTRANVKRAILNWARSSDVEATDEEKDMPHNAESETEEILPTPTKMNGTSRSRPGNVSRTHNRSRQLRNRRGIAERVDNETYEGSDDEPLSQHISQSNRPPSNVSSALITRSSRSTVPTAAHDHNYVSARGTPANTNGLRRILSRHQRNADELDSSIDPLEDSALLTRLRRLPRSTSNEQQEQVDQRPVRRGRSRYSQDNSQSTVEQEDVDIPSDEGTDGTQTRDSIGSEDDSEDNQPLTAIVPRARNRLLALEQQTENDYVNGNRNSRRRRVYGEDEPGHSQGQQREGSTREKRNQKRPRYNEETDEDDDNTELRQKRHRGDANPVSNVLGVSAVVEVNNTYENSSDDQQAVTVSSRGRVRKLTAKARERQLW